MFQTTTEADYDGGMNGLLASNLIWGTLLGTVIGGWVLVRHPVCGFDGHAEFLGKQAVWAISGAICGLMVGVVLDIIASVRRQRYSEPRVGEPRPHRDIRRQTSYLLLAALLIGWELTRVQPDQRSFVAAVLLVAAYWLSQSVRPNWYSRAS
jgi:MFS family permease